MSEIYRITDYLKNEVIVLSKKNTSVGVPEHSHEFIEMIYVCDGSAKHEYKGQTVSLSKNQFVFVDSGEKHRLTHKSEDLCVIQCLFVPAFLDASLGKSRTFADVLNHYLVGHAPLSESDGFVFSDENGRAESILEEMLAEFSAKQPGYAEFIRADFIRVLLLAMREIHAASRIHDEKVRRMAEFAERDYAEKELLRKVAYVLGYSESYLSAAFKSELGMTFSDFLRKTRMRVGCHLLADTSFSVEEIAERCGYADVRSFRKKFIQIMGMTPVKYRKSVRK